MVLDESFLHLDLLDEDNLVTANDTLSEPLDDGSWYEITVNIFFNKIQVDVKGNRDRCSDNPCQLAVSYPSNYNHFVSAGLGQVLFGTDFASFSNLTANQLSNGMTGCIRNLYLSSSNVLNLTDHFNAKYPAEPGCPREELCYPNPCANEGECASDWNSYSCQCTSAFTGINCTQGI